MANATHKEHSEAHADISGLASLNAPKLPSATAVVAGGPSHNRAPHMPAASASEPALPSTPLIAHAGEPAPGLMAAVAAHTEHSEAHADISGLASLNAPSHASVRGDGNARTEDLHAIAAVATVVPAHAATGAMPPITAHTSALPADAVVHDPAHGEAIALTTHTQAHAGTAAPGPAHDEAIVHPHSEATHDEEAPAMTAHAQAHASTVPAHGAAHGPAHEEAPTLSAHAQTVAAPAHQGKPMMAAADPFPVSSDPFPASKDPFPTSNSADPFPVTEHEN